MRTASPRLAAAVGVFSCVRTGWEGLSGGPSWVGSAVGGGCALAAVTAGEPGRREYFIKYYGGMLGRPGGRAPLPLVLLLTAVSGAVTLGGADTVLRWVAPGLRW